MKKKTYKHYVITPENLAIRFEDDVKLGEWCNRKGEHVSSRMYNYPEIMSAGTQREVGYKEFYAFVRSKKNLTS